MAERVQIEGYKYIECRRGGAGLGHAWSVLGWYMGRDDRMHRKDQCLRCPVIRNNTIEGWITRRSYTYPDDYQLDHRPTSTEITEEVMSRVGKVYRSELDFERAQRRRNGHVKAAAG